MSKKQLYTKTKMYELVGWSESNGRRWVKNFKEYLPTVTHRNKLMFTGESLKVMTYLKGMNEAGFTIPEIKQRVDEEGMPKNLNSAIQEVKENKVEKNTGKEYDEQIANSIPFDERCHNTFSKHY